MGIMGGSLFIYETLESTSSYLKDNISSFRNGDVLAARIQTNGRGRHQRKWISGSCKDLTFSMLISLSQPAQVWPNISQAAALALCKIIQSCSVIPWIKWPNDVCAANGKIAGILSEVVYSPFQNKTTPFLILGIGFNVNSVVFERKELSNACSLAAITAKTFDTDLLLQSFLHEFTFLFSSLNSHGFAAIYDDFYRFFSPSIGKTVSHCPGNDENSNNKDCRITITGINKSGALCAVQNGKNVELLWGEIIF